MKTKYRFIHFVETTWGDKIKSYHCYNNKSQTKLGLIEYYTTWKQYVFESYAGNIFSQDCLADIIDFMKQLS